MTDTVEPKRDAIGLDALLHHERVTFVTLGRSEDTRPVASSSPHGGEAWSVIFKPGIGRCFHIVPSLARDAGVADALFCGVAAPSGKKFLFKRITAYRFIPVLRSFRIFHLSANDFLHHDNLLQLCSAQCLLSFSDIISEQLYGHYHTTTKKYL